MSDLYLNPGESLILTTNRISVNFIPFDLMLTSLRIIILDNDHNRFSPQVIPIGDIFSVNGGSISTGEPILRITIMDHDGDGSLIPLDFIFSQGPNQKRKQERDEWLRALMEKLVAVRQEKVLSGIQPADEGEGERPPVRRWIAPEILHPVPLDVAPDLPASEPESVPGTSEPVVVPEENPAGSGGTPHVAPEFEGPPASAGEAAASDSTAPRVTPAEIAPSGEPGPAAEETVPNPEKIAGPAGTPVPRAQITEIPYEAVRPGAEPSIPREKENEPSTPGVSAGIESDEPRDLTGKEPADELSPVTGPGLAEKSEEATADGTMVDHPLRESHPSPPSTAKPPLLPVNWPVLRKPPVSPASSPRKPDAVNAVVLSSPPEEAAEPAIAGGAVLPEEKNGETGLAQEPVKDEPPKPEVPPAELEQDLPVLKVEQTTGGLEPGSSGITPQSPVAGTGANVPRRNPARIAAFVVIIGLVLAIAGLGILFLHNLPDTTPAQIPLVPQVVTPNATITVTPSPVPNVGVWVHVMYPQYFYGRIGNPGETQDIGGTGDQFYFIRNSGSLVQADIQKQDNSGDVLSVEVYRNGIRVFNSSVRSPMGAIHILINPVTGKPPVPGT